MTHWLEERRRDDERHAERNRKADDYDRVAAELARLRLTDAERITIQRLVEDYEQDGEPASAGCVATLRGLLEKHNGGER